MPPSPLDKPFVESSPSPFVEPVYAARCLARFVLEHIGEGVDVSWSDAEVAVDANQDGMFSQSELIEYARSLAPNFASAHGDGGLRLLVLDSNCLQV